MYDFNILYEYCLNKAQKLGSIYVKLLHFEYQEIQKQGAEQYWIDLIKSGKKFKTNKNKLVLPYLLNITSEDPTADQRIMCRMQNILDLNDPGIFKDMDMPDIDLDFIPEARDQIKQWAIQRFGSDKVCSVGLWQSYNPRSALSDVARALGYDDKKKELIVLGKALPVEFDDLDFKQAYNDFEQFKEWADRDPINKEIAEKAFRLIGKIKAQGKHAGGLIISSIPLHDCLPMAYLKDHWTSEWTEGRNVQLSKFGFIKYDILGLKTLQYIYYACNIIKQIHNVDINWDTIGYDDQDALQLANSLKTDSIFQFDTDVAKKILADGGVKSFNDLLVYTSLGRPGPMPMIAEYIKRRDNLDHNWKQKEHPMIIDMFPDTYGIIVYQEQVTEILTKLAGFTIPEADKARKIMSKKWADQMTWVREKAIRGFTQSLNTPCPLSCPEADNENMAENIKLIHEIDGTTQWTWAKEYWKRLETFARYSFNLSHAVSYSIQAYRCLYLKAHYATEWWSAVLNGCDLDRIPKYIMTAKSEGIQFGSLDCNNLSETFSVVNNSIIPGLLGIKNIGSKMLQSIDFNQQYNSLDDFINYNGKNKILLERLIKLGAFDNITPHRKALWYWYQYQYGTTKDAKEIKMLINKQLEWPADKLKDKRKQLTDDYFEKYPKRRVLPKKIQNWTPSLKDITYGQFINICTYKNYKLSEQLDFQKEYLGYYWDSPIILFKYNNKHSIKNAILRRIGILECVILSIDYRQTSNNNQFLTLNIVDNVDIAKVNIWNNDIELYGPKNYFNAGVGLKLEVKWNATYKSFTLTKNSIIQLLQYKEEKEDVTSG